MKEQMKKSVITIETWQKTVIRYDLRPEVWCEHCAATVERISLEQSAHILQTSERAIIRRIETGEVHFTETPEGKLLICGNSLL